MFKKVSGDDLILASSSPRRRELLTESGLIFRIEVRPVDESVRPAEEPQAMVERLALDKAEAVARQFPHAWVIGADTTVVQDGVILGKPADAADALRMLSRLQGTLHQVWSAFALVGRAHGREHVEAGCTDVEMMPQTRAELERYIATGEPMDKAGAYAIQGRGAGLIKRINGSYSNVVGLDMAALMAALRRFEIVT